MKVLVTGVSGFIGSRLVPHLIEEGHDVVGTGRGHRPNLDSLIKYLPADLANAEDCDRIVTGVDTVIHCAGKAGAWGAYAEYALANVLSTERLLHASREARVRRFINISSPSVYFDYRHQFNLTEGDLPRRFSNAYAATKYDAEKRVTAAHGDDFQTLSLRPRGVIGAGDRNWLPRIIALREANRLVQPGDGENLADFTAVENLIDAVSLCMAAPVEAMGKTYNITNGKPEKLWDFIDQALGAVGLDGKRRHLPLPLVMAVARMTEGYHQLRGHKVEPEILPLKVGVAAYSMTLDITAAREHLGYRPRLTTEQALIEFVDWWRQRQQ